MWFRVKENGFSAVSKTQFLGTESSRTDFSSFDSDCDLHFYHQVMKNARLLMNLEDFRKTKRQKTLQQFEVNESQTCCSKSVSKNNLFPESIADIPQDNSPVNDKRIASILRTFTYPTIHSPPKKTQIWSNIIQTV